MNEIDPMLSLRITDIAISDDPDSLTDVWTTDDDIPYTDTFDEPYTT